MIDKTIKRQVGKRTVELGPIGPDIDLDEEAVYLEDGTRLTEEMAEQMGREMMADLTERRRGRPSVTGTAQRTPNLTIRVAPAVRQALEAIARAQGRRVSDVGRDALAEYAKRHTRTATPKKAAPVKAAARKAAPRKAAAKKAAPRKTSTS